MSYAGHVRRAAVTGASGLLLLALAGCGGGDEAAPPPLPSPYGSSPTASPSPTAPYGPSPLTGLPASSAKTASRPAFGVAVSGADMAGLDDADLVFEEESAPARYIAVYQSRDSDRIGPLGQGRSTDPQVLGMLRGAVGYASIRPGPLSQFKEMGATDVGRPGHASAYHSSGGRTYTSTKDMYAAIAKLKDKPGSAPTMFSYAAAGKPLASEKMKDAKSLTITVPGHGTQRWSYTRGEWRRTSGGPRVTAANVIVQHTEYKLTNIAKGGVKAPKAKVFGKGTCQVVSGAHAASGRWSRQAPDAQILYVDADSFPFRLAPGRTWVVLAPPGTTAKVRS